MKIATWNVKGRAALPWYNEKNEKVIKRETVNRIMVENADIFVITEIALGSGWDYLEEEMKKNEYVWFYSFVSGSNGILILVKENLIKDTKELANKLWKKEEILHSYNDIGLMKVSFGMKDGKTCTVCGFRMLVGGNTGRAQYDDMREILYKNIMPIAEECYLKNDIVIFAGDFNNAKYRNDYSGKDQINYTLQIIRSKFENIGYIMFDVDDTGSPLDTYCGKNGLTSPIDHIFAKGFEKTSCNVSPIYGECSDHYVLWAEVKESE